MSFLLWHGLRNSALLHPDRPAVEWRRETLTYRELDERSNGFASMLLRAGIGRGHRVGLFAPKSHLSVVAMLGTLKAGATYVPVDPHAPALRAAYILGNCGVSAIVTTADRLASLEEHRDSLSSLRIAIVNEAPAEETAWVETMLWRDVGCGTGPRVAAGHRDRPRLSAVYVRLDREAERGDHHPPQCADLR